MASPAICLKSADTPNGSILIKDITPNRSQASAVYDPAPQGPRYIRQPEDALPSATNGVMDAEVIGLSAYILVNTDDGLGRAITPVQASSIATAVIARMRAGLSLTEGQLNILVNDEVAGAKLIDTVLTSSGAVDDVLAILAGARFTVPAGYEFDDGAFIPAINSVLFNEGKYQRVDEDEPSFWISVEQGDLLKAKNDRIDPNTGATLPPLVVVYDGEGNIL